MSATGLEVFDRTLQTTNIWLGEVMAVLGSDRQLAWKVLSTVLHKLRDRLPLALAAHLGSQLPLLVRGVYYDQFEPGKEGEPGGSYEDFRAEVAAWLSDVKPVDPDLAIAAVFALLSRHISPGQVTKVRSSLPKGMRQRWDQAEEAARHLSPETA